MSNEYQEKHQLNTNCLGGCRTAAEHERYVLNIGPKLVGVNTRLFADDVEMIKRIAKDSTLPWQVELRLLVRRALRGEKREIVVLKDQA